MIESLICNFAILKPHIMKKILLNLLFIFSFSTLLYSQTTIIHQADFESSTDGWIDGGTNAVHSSSNAYSGSWDLRMGGNTSTSNWISPSFALSTYDKVDFKFFFYATGFDNYEKFYIEYRDNNTASWNTIATFRKGTISYTTKTGDFGNYYFLSKTVTIFKTAYTFPASATAQFRVRSASSSTSEYIYFDKVSISGTKYKTPTKGPGGVTANLDLWLRADKVNGTTVAADGSNVSKWVDNGKGNDAEVVVSGQEPTYRNNTTRNMNFNPVVDFQNDSNTSAPDMSYINTRDELKGTGGFNSNDIFIVLMPDPTVTTSLIPMDTFTSTDPLGETYSEDVTGIGYGAYSARFLNERFSYCIGTTQNQYETTGVWTDSGYGRADTISGVDYNKIGIINVQQNATNTDMELYLNANVIGTTTSDISKYAMVNNTRYWLGRSQYWNGSFGGRIAEVITYSARKNDATERNKIQSYLAIKYGITLGSNGISQDYVDSAGNVIWDQAANAGYNYDITGIGRDDAAALNQKQSKSVNSDFDATGQIRGLVTMGLTDISTTNSANTAAFPTDKEYLTWGNNNGNLNNAPNVVNVDMSAGISGLSTPVTFTGMERVWKVTEHGGDIPKVKVSIPKNAVRNISPPGSYLMFISDTGIFNPTADYRVMKDDGTNLSTEYDFDGTKYITFGYAPEIKVVRSIYFDGVKDYIDMEDALNLNPSEFTISAWIKRDPTSVNASIISKRDALYTEGYDFKIDSSGKIEMSWGASGAQKITSNTIIPGNVWHQVAVIYNGTTASLYIDGVLDKSANLTPPASTTQSFYIAAAGKLTHSSFFKGNIDEVRVWDVALTTDQLHYIMNQEIEDNAGNLNGNIIPQTITKNNVATIPWTKLAGYYPMSVYTYTNTNDMSGNDNQGALRNLNTVDYQTAPLPYQSQNVGNWDTSTNWLNNTVQDLPNSISIVDGTKRVDWNIVETNHTINTTRNVNVLGLMNNANELSINADNSLTVSHYLLINGVIDLDGESQLIQTTGSDFDNASTGHIERDQQGEGNKFRYNDWSSPVYTAADGNGNYTTVSAALKDGTSPASPGAINYVSGVDGSLSPLTLSTYWMYKYANLPDNSYSSWDHIGNTGKIYAAEGFLMKGAGNPGASDQNYVFVGKPNNGDINLTINANYDYLVGNPYPSAIDAYQFIDDNPDITGPLYFWEHYGGDTHNLADYQAGYATLTKSGGVKATAGGGYIPSQVSGLGTATKTPGQYIPVSQGFFVYSSTGGTIHFKNSQRVFVKEASGTSVFMKPSKGKGGKTSSSPKNNQLEDTRPKFRIGFDAPKIDHRQLLLTIDENTSDAVDWGYEAEIYEIFGDDMYWIIGDKKYVIQATNEVSADKEIPLGIQLSESGKISIDVDNLENVDDKTQLYIKDKLTGETYNIKNKNFEMELEAGNYMDRFVLTFQPRLKTLQETTLDKGINAVVDQQNSVLNIIKTVDTKINNITIFNMLGQLLQNFSNNSSERQFSFPLNLVTGIYIIKIDTENGIITKKIIKQ